MKPLLTVATIAAALVATSAMADLGAEIGVLTCKLKGVHNDIVYTKEELGCEFKPKSGDTQSYTGVIKSIGIDLSMTKDATMVWGVLAPTNDKKATEMLKGTYLGGTAAIALGAGAGANVLVGGGDHSIALQPVSLSGVIGSGASLDISEFELK